MQAVEEWRLGDAIWFRYHMDGLAVDGVYTNDNVTVEEEIVKDASEYLNDHPQLFSDSISILNTTSNDDNRKYIVEMISGVSGSISERMPSYSTSCGTNWGASRQDCEDLINYMPTDRLGVGRRAIDYFGNCNLRQGPSGQIRSYYVIHKIAGLIQDDCGFCPTACWSEVFTSGWSPRNDQHRKICLSRKSTGCS